MLDLQTDPKPSRYLIYRALGALVPYIVGTWGVRVMLKFLGSLAATEHHRTVQCRGRVEPCRCLKGFLSYVGESVTPLLTELLGRHIQRAMMNDNVP